MGNFRLISVFLFLAPLAAGAGEQGRVYRWVDADGKLHYSDSVPAQYAEMDKQVLNDHGVTIARLRPRRGAPETEIRL